MARTRVDPAAGPAAQAQRPPPGRRGARILGRGLTRIEEDLPALLLAATVVLVAVDVAGRYVLNRPLVGTGEAATTLMIWQVFLGAAGAARRRLHIGLAFVVDRLKGRPRAAVDLLATGTVLLLLAVVARIGWGFALQSTSKQLQMLGLSYVYVNLAVPVGCALIALHYVGRFAAAIVGLSTGEYHPPSDAELAARSEAERVHLDEDSDEDRVGVTHAR